MGQFLKFAQLITNGGEAKHYLLSHVVLVNQQLENRRGRKLYPEDQVQIDKEIYLVSKEMKILQLKIKHFRNIDFLDLNLKSRNKYFLWK